jgi:hypothetical protein
MTKRRSSRRHSRRHSRGIKKGGSGNYSSASSYGTYVNGSGNDQFNRVFETAGRQSNVLVGAQGQWSQPPNAPSAQNLTKIQSAGKSRRKRKGGFFGEIIKQAVVPFGILALQQSYKRKKHGGKTRRHKR